MKAKTHITITLLLIVLLALLLSACDSGLKYVRIEIETLPEKTVYFAGEDSFLQFDGGTVRLTTADGSTSTEDMRSYTYRHEEIFGGEDCYISSDVNFDLPGAYTVTIYQTKELSCQYGIEVRSR